MPSELETRVMRRISFRIVPFIMLLYFIAFIDRVNIGFAALTMNKDLGFSPAVFGLGAGIFFVGYFLFEVPSNLILNKVGARLWIARVMITWGIISALFAFIQGETSFLILRFLLGVAEAGFFPGIILYLSFWFPARYRAGVVSLFMAAAPISVVLGSPLSSALLEMDGLLGLRGWQWMFIMEAIPAFLLGFVVLGYMTDKPEKATWLKDDEREWLVNEMAAEHAAKAATASHSIWRGLADLRVLALSLIYFGTSAGLYTLGIWAPQIIKEFGLSSLQVGFLNAVPPTVAVDRNGALGTPFGQDQRTHLARRCGLHRRSCGTCTRRIRRVMGIGCCRAHARKYRHQLGEATALGHADHVPYQAPRPPPASQRSTRLAILAALSGLRSLAGSRIRPAASWVGSISYPVCWSSRQFLRCFSRVRNACRQRALSRTSITKHSVRPDEASQQPSVEGGQIQQKFIKHKEQQMRTHRIAAMGGDGIGPEVVAAGVAGSQSLRRARWSVQAGISGFRLGLGLLQEARRHDAGRRRRSAAQIRRHPVRLRRRSRHPGPHHVVGSASGDLPAA